MMCDYRKEFDKKQDTGRFVFKKLKIQSEPAGGADWTKFRNSVETPLFQRGTRDIRNHPGDLQKAYEKKD